MLFEIIYSNEKILKMDSIYMIERIYDIVRLVLVQRIAKIVHGSDMMERIKYMNLRILLAQIVYFLVSHGLLQMRYIA